ncbi:MAG: ParA family protein [Gammaproteobacteria bacterium]|nr:ParA family protein [Gammaproteobacteria bacterium]
MKRIIAIANQKGGVGKTTTCVNLAAALAMSHKRVLVIDLDPQGNATMGCGVDKYSLQRSAYELLVGKACATDAIVSTEFGFDLIPSNADLTAAEVELMSKLARERCLLKALQSVQDNYDYILIDCPPSLNLLTLNAFVAADGVIIPMQCEYYALEGLSALVETINDVRSSVNPSLKIEGLLRTMFDSRNNLGNDVSDQLLKHFGDQVYRTVIPRNVRLAEAPSHGRPVIHYDKTSRGALAYLALAGEMVRKEVCVSGVMG